MTLARKLAAIMSALTWRQPRIAAELRESELRFRQVTDNIREVFFLCDPEITHMFYISPGYAKIWGRSCESSYDNPQSFTDAIHVDDRERAMQTIAPHGTLIPNDVEYRIVRPDGTIRWISARGFPIRDERGDVYRFAGIAEDITERKRALDLITRQALEHSTRRLSLLGEMTGLLQTVVKVEEAAAIVGGYAAQLHVGDGGAIYLFKESRNALDLLARWGELTLADSVVPDECWALRQRYARPRCRGCRAAPIRSGPDGKLPRGRSGLPLWGEEFTVVIPGATCEATTEWAERLLGSVRDMKAIADGRVLPPITVSISIACFPEYGEETTEVIQAADQALYTAKHAGRDRFVFSAKKPGLAGGVGQGMRGGAE